MRGLSALVPLRGDTATRWIVKSPVALHMGFQSVPGRYPGSLLGVIAYQRQMFYDAQRHALLVERYKSNPTGMPRASYDADLDALVPVVKGETPVFFAANQENEVRRAVAVGAEFKLAVSVVGVTEGFRALDALKGARLPVVSVDFPGATQVTGWQYRGAQRVAQDDSATRAALVQKQLEGNAAAIHNAGIRFALASGGLAPNDFSANVMKAVAAGLPRATAIEALTIRAAEAAGVEKQLGSIEPGKIANLVLVEGELLTESGKIRSVFVDGEEYDVVPTENAGRGRPAGQRRPPQENR
jgi:imidazolonepropionase-like amidohydrolase